MIKIGTCSWNYPSWKGLVYTKAWPRSADCLPEYAKRYRTVEIDSWFYKIPDPAEVEEYILKVDPDFTFTAKVWENITLTHGRTHGKANKSLIPNPSFLNPEVFDRYLKAIEMMLPQIDALELEFEYLNQEKMSGLDTFLRHLEIFVSAIPSGLPIAIETRNKNYLSHEYFQFLRDHRLAPVLCEKIYMPHIYEVIERYGDMFGDLVVIRLLGGDRREIEAKTKGIWNSIVEPKEQDLGRIHQVIATMPSGKRVIVSVNNHYEGSAPLTIERLLHMWD